MRAALKKLLEAGEQYIRVSFRVLSGVIEKYYGVSERMCGTEKASPCSTLQMERAIPFFIFAQSEGASRFEALNHLEALRRIRETSLLVDFDGVRSWYEDATGAAGYMESNLVPRMCNFICVLEGIKPQGRLDITGTFGSPYEFYRY